MKLKRIRFLIIPLILLLFGCTTSQVNWPEPTAESKPWTRWWWMGNAVDSVNLKRELQEFAEMGIGGVEITPIYGVKGEEERFIEFLTPEFTDVLQYTIDEAAKLSMGVDLPPGSGWRCGGPFVPREKGLWNLRITKYDLENETAWNAPDSWEEIAAASYVDRNGKVFVLGEDYSYSGSGGGTIYAAVREKSGNLVKRPSKGGEGWAIDTFDKEITNWYLDEFWKRLGIGEGQMRCFFHDSFEYTGDFTPKFLTEFRKRRGYDLAEVLHILAGDHDNEEMIDRVKSDYRETLADLVLESFIQPMTEWANRHQSLNRNQAHGSPGNILDLYAACDIPETEIFSRLNRNSPDVYVNKFASSAANVSGRKLVSSESYTWLDEHWTVTSTDLVKATNRFFLAGVNHIFFHGTCYSPEDATWPGWLFYASTQMNNRNPIWREMPTLFSYIQRTQSVMQRAKPDNHLLIYWPYYDVAAEKGRLFNHIGVNRHAGWFYNHPIYQLSEQLTAAGYTFDFISDKQLNDCTIEKGEIITSGGARYEALVIPESKYVPIETMQNTVKFLEEGGAVFFDNKLPESVPGLYNLENRELKLSKIKQTIGSAFVGDAADLLVEAGIAGEQDLAQNGFHFLKMTDEGDETYLVFNITDETRDHWITLNSNPSHVVFMNPMTGEITRASVKQGKVRLQLRSEEILYLRCVGSTPAASEHNYFSKETEQTKVTGAWNVEFISGGPEIPENTIMKNLTSWTEAGVTSVETFAGTARYSVQFQWDGPGSGLLDLGDVKDCARIFLNGKELGTLLGPDYSIEVENLAQGENTLEVEVTNIAANRIRDMDIRGVPWRIFHDINLVNIDYEAFDASAWEIREAGLLGPVRIYVDKDD